MRRGSERFGQVCGAPVIAGLVFLLGVAAADAKAPPPAPAPPGSPQQTEPSIQGPLQQMQAAGEKEQAVDEYRQDYDVSREEAERRLALQGEVDDLKDKLIDRLGDGFSQVYFDNTDGIHVVAISSRGSRERAEQAMADLGLQTRVVQRSQDHRQLKASIDALNRELRERIKRGRVGVGLTAEGIKVLIAGSASADERAAVRATVKDNASDATVVQTSRSTLQAEPAVSCNGSNGRYCNELIAGIRYHTANGGGCTAGFYSGPANVYDPKMMTAGHCITPGGVTWSSCKAGGSPCPYAGYERENRYGGQSGDNGILQFDAPYNWTIVPGAFDWAYGVRRVVTGVIDPVLGYQVCHFGATTGQSCGTVDNTYYSRIYGAVGPYPDTYIEGVSRVVNICVRRGDSGGPATMNGGSWATGLVSGVDSYPEPCNSGTLLVEPITRVQNTYGIYVYGG